MTGQKIKKRMTREQRVLSIVNAASMLFASKGLKGTTTKEIAREAGISEAMIFKYFSKKEALYSAIIDLKCNDTRGHSRLMKALVGKEGRQVFCEVANFLITEIQKDPSFLRLILFSALEGHALLDIFMKTKGMELIDFLAGNIKSMRGTGLVRDDIDPVLSARAFIGMVIHYSISQEIYGLKKYFKASNKRVVDTFVDVFFEGIEGRQG